MLSSCVPIPVAEEVLLAIETTRVLTVTPTPNAALGVKSILSLEPSI